jgi:predicted ArsR family transcriptional regulator
MLFHVLRGPATHSRIESGGTLSPKSVWTFVTNHGAVLSILSHEEMITAREIAARLGITVRTVRRIIGELEMDGYLEIEKIGRRNRYQVNRRRPLRREDQREVAIADLLEILQHPSN